VLRSDPERARLELSDSPVTATPGLTKRRLQASCSAGSVPADAAWPRPRRSEHACNWRVERSRSGQPGTGGQLAMGFSSLCEVVGRPIQAAAALDAASREGRERLQPGAHADAGGPSRGLGPPQGAARTLATLDMAPRSSDGAATRARALRRIGRDRLLPGQPFLGQRSSRCPPDRRHDRALQ
jgi:hypothetical protein